jgi:hypothetical protein
MVVHAYNSSTQKADCKFPGQPGVHSETLSQNNTMNKTLRNLHISKAKNNLI